MIRLTDVIDTRIDVRKGIAVNKTSSSRKCIIGQYPYFLEVNCRFQPEVCDTCHDLMKKAMSFNAVAILSVKEILEFPFGT